MKPRLLRPLGNSPGGPRLRHRQWRHVDFDGDSLPGLPGGAEDGRFHLLRNPRSAR